MRVYVITPSLNKSFKFQSDWPYNNSQIYLLGSIIDDLNDDTNMIKEEENGKYIYTSTVNYPNNNELKKQKVTVSKDLLIEKIEVIDEKGNPEMAFTVSNINYDPSFDESYFEVNSIINLNTNTDNNCTGNNCNKDTCTGDDCKSNTDTNKSTDKNKSTDETEQTATLEDVIYPLYLPTGTVLSEQEKVSKTDGERIILTFTGEKGFTLVEETASKESEFTVVPTYGEPYLINDTIGSLTESSINWISGNIEYYLVSDVMSSDELLDIARSINIKAVANMK